MQEFKAPCDLTRRSFLNGPEYGKSFLTVGKHIFRQRVTEAVLTTLNPLAKQ